MSDLVAVTGATGFVGAAVVRRLLAENWRVRILTRRMPHAALSANHSIEVILGDLGDAGALARLVTGASAIVHVAGLVKALTAAAFFEVNRGGTARLLLAAAAAAPRARLIHVSSLAARAPDLSPYAASKAAAEQALADMAGQRDWVALRPPAVYGPGDRELLPIFRAARLGILAYPAAQGARFSVIHVDDLAAAVLALLAAPAWPDRHVEIDDGAACGHDWPAVVQALSEAVGGRPAAWRLPRTFFLPIAAGTEAWSRIAGRPQVLSRAKVNELYHADWVVRGPGLADLGIWQPRFSLAAGFADTATWYRRESLLRF